jgi:cell wall-associated NlpC family hydrolase
VREATRIEPAQWLKDVYARCKEPTDLLRFPTPGYEHLAPEEKDRLRQTEIEGGEIVRVLGHADEFTLAMKFDRTLGWVPKGRLEAAPQKAFSRVVAPRKTSAEFLSSWKGIPYVWGGASRRGIDCSGFTQRYFLEVHGIVIPKNSRDQRKAGHPKGLEEPLQDDDLIFCYPRAKGPGTHHVAVFHDQAVWHARLDFGVVRQSWEEFVSIFQVEEIVTVCENKSPEETIK